MATTFDWDGGTVSAATLHVVEGADHGFEVKGRTQDDVAGELVEVVGRFCAAALG